MNANRKRRIGGVLLLVAVAAGFLLPACGDRQEAAVEELYDSDYAFTVEEFLRAAGSGDLQAVRWFLGAGMEAGVADISKTSALHLAAAAGQSAVVKELIVRGADPSLVRLDGRTPVMMAAEAGDGLSVELLLDAGGSAVGKDSKGWSAVALAAYGGFGRAVEALVPFSRPHLDDALMLAAMGGHVEAIDPLVSGSAKVDVRSPVDRTPLMLAAARGHRDAVKLLLHYGANWYAIDVEANTASQLASSAGHKEIVAMLDSARLEENDGREGDSSFVPEGGGEPIVYSSLTRRIDGERLLSTDRRIRDLREVMKMMAYRERQLPIAFDGVVAAGGGAAEIRVLFGDNETYLVNQGEVIPGTGLELVAVELHWSRGKEGQGEAVSAARLVVRELESGAVIGVTDGDPGRSAKSFALVRYEGTDQSYELRRGDRFHALGKEFRVMDVRSGEVVFEEFGRGEVTVLTQRR